MSASAIIDNLITMLSAASAFGTGGVSGDYGVMESVSGSCVVIEVLSFTNIEDTYNHTSRTDWTISLRGFSKDTGDPGAVLSRVTGIVDITNAVIRADRTLLGAVQQVTTLRGSREIGTTYDAAGATWLDVPMQVDCYEFPDG